MTDRIECRYHGRDFTAQERWRCCALARVTMLAMHWDGRITLPEDWLVETFVQDPPWDGDAATDTSSETNPGKTSGSDLSEKTGNESSIAETRQSATA